MLPKVVIVGRPNVGKSSLLNLLAGRRVAIVDQVAGVTRDRVGTPVELSSATDQDPVRSIELIDTGGYGIVDATDLTTEIEQQIAAGVAEADLILFVVDIQIGMTPLDQDVARSLRTSGGAGTSAKPVLMIANKVDGKSHEQAAYEMAGFGFSDPIMVSATNGYKKQELLDQIAAHIDWDHFDQTDKTDEQDMLLAIVGKRNTGKSTLVNALAGVDRMIVSEIEGTTRDSVDVQFELHNRSFTAIDTAGVRKAKSVKCDIDYYSHHRSLRSIRRADVVLLLIDAAVPISQVDRKLANEILKHHRPCVILVNKWDLAEKSHTQQEYADYIDRELQGLKFAPIVFTTAKDAEGIHDAVMMALNLYQQAGHRVNTSEINRVIEQILTKYTPMSKIRKRPKVYYSTQLSVHPPTIALFVNDPSLFDSAGRRYLINRFRDLLPFSEVPLKLLIRGRKKMSAEERLASHD